MNFYHFFNIFHEIAFSGTVLHFDHRFLNAVVTICPNPGSENGRSGPEWPKWPKLILFFIDYLYGFAAPRAHQPDVFIRYVSIYLYIHVLPAVVQPRGVLRAAPRAGAATAQRPRRPFDTYNQ